MAQRSRFLMAAVAVASMVVAACDGGASAAGGSPTAGRAGGPRSVTLLAHDAFAVSDSVLADFESRTGIKVTVVATGDAGELVNRAVLSSGKPEGDVLFGVDNTLLSRALDAHVFEPYTPAALDRVPAPLRDRSGTVAAIDYGDVCVNIDAAWFTARGIAPPRTLADLTDPAYKNLLVVQNPATSSPGLAFMLATLAAQGDPNSATAQRAWQQYWRDLRANGVKVVNGWTEAYTGEFTAGGGGGTRPLVVSYATSPPAELVYASDPKPQVPSTTVMEDGCYRQVEYAGVLRGAADPAAAREVVDFLLSPAVQADVPLSMFVFPAVAGTALPAEFAFAARPAAPVQLPAAVVAAGRDAWVEQWTATVLR